MLVCDSCRERIENCACYYRRDALATAALIGFLIFVALVVWR